MMDYVEIAHKIHKARILILYDYYSKIRHIFYLAWNGGKIRLKV